MKDMTDSNKRVLEQEQQDYTEPSSQTLCLQITEGGSSITNDYSSRYAAASDGSTDAI